MVEADPSAVGDDDAIGISQSDCEECSVDGRLFGLDLVPSRVGVSVGARMHARTVCLSAFVCVSIQKRRVKLTLRSSGVDLHARPLAYCLLLSILFSIVFVRQQNAT